MLKSHILNDGINNTHNIASHLTNMYLHIYISMFNCYNQLRKITYHAKSFHVWYFVLHILSKEKNKGQICPFCNTFCCVPRRRVVTISHYTKRTAICARHCSNFIYTLQITGRFQHIQIYFSHKRNRTQNIIIQITQIKCKPNELLPQYFRIMNLLHLNNTISIFLYFLNLPKNEL